MPIATVNTGERIDNNEIVAALMSRYQSMSDYDIYVASANADSLRLAVVNHSLRGVAVDNTSAGYEVRLSAMASDKDYMLFGDIVIELIKMTGGEASVDMEHHLSDEESASRFRWEAWRDYVTQDEMSELKDYVLSTGESRVYNGVFMPFVIGPRLLAEADYSRDVLIDRLVSMQWKYKDTGRAVQGQLGDHDTGQRVSLTIVDFSAEFPTGGLLLPTSRALMLNDPEAAGQAISLFRHSREIFRNAVVLDEEQVYLPQLPSIAEREEIGVLIRLFNTRYIFEDPIMPGEGSDDRQRTFILTWNPEISTVKIEDFLYWIDVMRTENSNWSVSEHDKVSAGDKWYLVACGDDGPKGIVASGVFDSNAWEGDGPSKKGRKVYYCDLRPNVLVNPLEGSLIGPDRLNYLMPDFKWDGGSSGRMLDKEYAAVLEQLWHDRLEQWRANPKEYHVRIMR